VVATGASASENRTLSREQTMFIAMNRFRIAPGREEEFLDI
jgi:hypothetical protein